MNSKALLCAYDLDCVRIIVDEGVSGEPYFTL